MLKIRHERMNYADARQLVKILFHAGRLNRKEMTDRMVRLDRVLYLDIPNGDCELLMAHYAINGKL